MFSFSPQTIQKTTQSVSVHPRAVYTDFTPAGPWTDGTVVTRNSDGVGFTYSAALNALTINSNLSASIKNANNLGITNVPDPVNNLDAANKEYVDAHAGSGGGGAPPSTTLPLMDGTAAIGTGTTYARADHVHPSDTSRAPLASPALTGVPTAPTAPGGTGTTQIATCAFVYSNIPTGTGTVPLMDGTAAVGSEVWTYARGDHVHPSDTTKLSDAASDGSVYGRKNGAWSAIAGAAPLVLRSYLAGLTLSTAGSSTTFSVAAGTACDSTGVDMLSLASSISKTTGAWAVGTGNGALDTGTIANSTWYHVYIIKRTDTNVTDPLVSLSATSPTLPSSYTEFRRIGSMKTNASGQWAAFTQLGDEFLWNAASTDVNVSTLGTSSTLYTLASVPSGIQVIALIRGYVQNAAGIQALVSSGDENAVVYNSPVGNVTVSAGAGLTVAWSSQLRTNSSSQIRAVSSSASTTFAVATYGWRDRRGRDS